MRRKQQGENMKPKGRFIKTAGMSGRIDEWAMIIEEDHDRYAEAEWFKKKEDARKDMVAFLKAALVVAEALVVEEGG
jgi:hypothetical protein